MTADICKEKGLKNPLEHTILVMPPGVTLNEGLEDSVLLQIARRKAGRCRKGFAEADVTSAGWGCDQHTPLKSLDMSGARGEVISIEETKAKMGID